MTDSDPQDDGSGAASPFPPAYGSVRGGTDEALPPAAPRPAGRRRLSEMATETTGSRLSAADRRSLAKLASLERDDRPRTTATKVRAPRLRRDNGEDWDRGIAAVPAADGTVAATMVPSKALGTRPTTSPRRAPSGTEVPVGRAPSDPEVPSVRAPSGPEAASLGRVSSGPGIPVGRVAPGPDAPLGRTPSGTGVPVERVPLGPAGVPGAPGPGDGERGTPDWLARRIVESQVPEAAYELGRQRRWRRRKATVMRSRSSRRLVRRIDTWTVFKVSLIFYFLMLIVVLVAGLVIWSVAQHLGFVGDIQKSVRSLADDRKFILHGSVAFEYSAAGGAVLGVIGTLFNTVAAMLYNLLSDVFGGVQVIVISEPD